jgi:hypothetical protein
MKTIPLIALFVVLQSCSIEYRASKVATLEMNNMLDRHYETIWNTENNRPGEHDSSTKELIRYYKSIKNKTHEEVSKD